jgi:DNA-binding NtrC family response regulator
LVVEDEPAILELIVRILEPGGYRVLTASNATDALLLALDHGDQIDLLLTDVVMAGMNGPDLVRELSASGIYTRHLFMSGYPAHLIAHDGVLEGDPNFIQKPFSLSALSRKIRDILDNEASPAQ